MFKKTEMLKVNFVDQEPEKKARRQTYIVAAVFTLIVAVVAGIGADASYRAVKRGTGLLHEIENTQGILQVRQLFGADSNHVPDVLSKDQFNVLLLGIGGEGHDGSQLTDTILLASFDIPAKKIALTSIPRDLAFPLGNGRFEKINSVNAYAEQSHPGEGAKYTAEAFEKLLEIKIDHVIRVDFNGFAAFIDSIGGIDVEVPQAFTDPQYPTLDDKWTTVSFRKGPQHMDGATALVFVRSRHGNNGEGSDFARSRRQQLVLVALRQKLFSLGTLSDPSKIATIYSTITKHVQSDLSPWDTLKLAPRMKDLAWNQITNHVLTDAPDGELVSATVDGAYMLFPRKQDWSQIREMVQNPFATSTTPTLVNTPPVAPVEIAKIEIKNGTTRTGFAAQIAAMLEKEGYEISAFGNAVRRGYERTVIFDLSGGKKPAALARLRKELDATVSITLPSWIATANNSTSTRVVLSDGLAPERILSSSTDFLIILGEASYGLIAK